MKRRVLPLIATFMLILSMSVSAMETRVATPVPSLTFEETTAICAVDIFGSSASDKITATVKLWQGTTCLKTWTASDTGVLYFEETAPVKSGKTCMMTVDYSVAGRVYPRLSVTATCP